MSTVKDKNEARASVPTPEQVADFLGAHPGFLLERPELLAALAPPSRFESERVVDLQHALVRRLSDEVSSLRRSTEELIATTRGNMSSQQQVHRAVLVLMEADDAAELARVITEDLPALIDLDAAALCLEEDGDGDGHAARLGTPPLPPGGAAQAMDGRRVVLRADCPGDPAIYGAAAGLVRSDALVRLSPHPDLPEGVLALGARTRDAFNPGQGTELLVFLAQVVETLLRRHLTKPDGAG